MISKSKSFLVLAGTLAALPGLGQSVVVNYNAGPGLRDVEGSTGVTVPDGNEVEIGYFTSGFNVTANANSPSALEAAWHPFDSTTIKTIFGQPGRFAASPSGSNSAFDNQKIYLWIFQTSNNAAPTVSFGNVIGYGLYSSTLSNWTFPAQGSLPPDNTATVTSGDINQAFFGTIVGNSTSGHLQLTQVPEPFAASLAGAAASLGWAAWRRRLGS